MPSYDFMCDDPMCEGETVEVKTSLPVLISPDMAPLCPICGEHTRRVYTPISIKSGLPSNAGRADRRYLM